MKTKAIIRIIACSLLFSVLLGILSAGLTVARVLNGTASGETTTLERRMEAEKFRNIQIDWVAGSVTIKASLTGGDIIIKEFKDTKNRCTFTTEFSDDTLKIGYGSSNLPYGAYGVKELLVLVPMSWNCNQLEINGAAIKINVDNLTVNNLELSGAANELTFKGKLYELEAEGSGLKLDIDSNFTAPNHVSVEGMGCNLTLTLPTKAGFDVTIEGLGVSFHSNVEYQRDGSSYTYGNKDCKIDVSGLGCKVSVDPS